MATTIDLEFEKCLQFKKIREFSRGKSLVNKELESAQSDLKSARETFKAKNYKWSTIQCYYSMFHSARALLYRENLREKSHGCLIVALRALYVNKNKLSFDFIEALERAKMLREDADYYDKWAEDAAEFLLDKAKLFLQTIENMLK